MLEIKSALEEFGLTENEAEIYLLLLKLGNANAAEISQRTQVHRINVYDILDRLQEKGLVSFSMLGKRKVYFSEDPNKLLILENERKQNIEQIMPQLIGMKELEKSLPEVTVYKDRTSIKYAIDDQTTSKTPIYLFASGWGLQSTYPEYWEIYHSKLERNKIKVYMLLSNKHRDIKLPKVYYPKYLPSEFVFPSTTTIYDDKVLIVMWGASPLAIMIKSKEAFESYKNYFLMLYKIAKK